MRELIKKNRSAIIFSVAVHAMLLGLVFFSFESEPESKSLTLKPNIVKAVMVDASKVQAELDKLKRADERKKNQDKQRVAKLKREEQRLAQLTKKRKAEEKKRKIEQTKLAKLKKQQQALKKKQATQDKQRKAADKKRQATEKKRQAEKARQVKLKKEQDALKKKQAVAKKKRQAEKKQRQQELAQQLAAEDQAREDKLAKTEREKYMVLIRQRIERNWLKPPGKLKGLFSVVNIRLIPGGDVVSANIIKTSGNPVYDRSVERAALKASPLPLPRNPRIAAQMYDINLEFREE